MKHKKRNRGYTVILNQARYDEEKQKIENDRGQKITHEEIATEVGITRAQLFNLRSDKNSPSPESMANLCIYFANDLDELFTIKSLADDLTDT